MKLLLVRINEWPQFHVMVPETRLEVFAQFMKGRKLVDYCAAETWEDVQKYCSRNTIPLYSDFKYLFKE